MGGFEGHRFKDFELKVDVMTLLGANGGGFIDTEYLDSGWPAKAFEVQVNNTYVKDPRKTASLYEVKDNRAEVAKDNQWFTEHIIARGDTITIKVNDKVVGAYQFWGDSDVGQPIMAAAAFRGGPLARLRKSLLCKQQDPIWWVERGAA